MHYDHRAGHSKGPGGLVMLCLSDHKCSNRMSWLNAGIMSATLIHSSPSIGPALPVLL